MASSSEPPEDLIAFARILVTEQSLDATLSEVINLACTAVATSHMGGVTLLGPEGPTTAAATHEKARRVDAIQYQVGAGPCLDAYRRQCVNRIDSTVDDQRWPEFCQGAYQAGVLSTLSLPLVVGGDGLGALNLYSPEPNGFSEADERTGRLFASYAAVALSNARMFWRTQTLATQLEEALSTRGVIEQAKGILVAQQGCSDDEAFEILVRASQRTHVKLHDVAAQLVEGTRAQARERSQRSE